MRKVLGMIFMLAGFALGLLWTYYVVGYIMFFISTPGDPSDYTFFALVPSVVYLIMILSVGYVMATVLYMIGIVIKKGPYLTGYDKTSQN